MFLVNGKQIKTIEEQLDLIKPDLINKFCVIENLCLGDEDLQAKEVHILPITIINEKIQKIIDNRYELYDMMLKFYFWVSLEELFDNMYKYNMRLNNTINIEKKYEWQKELQTSNLKTQKLIENKKALNYSIQNYYNETYDNYGNYGNDKDSTGENKAYGKDSIGEIFEKIWMNEIIEEGYKYVIIWDQKKVYVKQLINAEEIKDEILEEYKKQQHETQQLQIISDKSVVTVDECGVNYCAGELCGEKIMKYLPKSTSWRCLHQDFTIKTYVLMIGWKDISSLFNIIQEFEKNGFFLDLN